MTTKSRLKHDQQVVVINMSLHLPTQQHLNNLRQTNKNTDWSVIRKLGWDSEILTFGIGNTTEAFHFPGNLELTKIWLKIWVSTGRTTGKWNFINDKGIPSTPASSDLMDITASKISLSLTVANDNSGTLFVLDTANLLAPSGVDWDQKASAVIGFIKVTNKLRIKPQIALKKPRKPWKNLNFSEKVFKNNLNLHKSATFINNPHFNLKFFEKTSHNFKKSSISLNMSSKILNFIENVFKNPQFHWKCLQKASDFLLKPPFLWKCL
jgi:hypothetical protein